MKHSMLISIILYSLVTILSAKEVPLWEGAAPGAKGETPKDIPTLTHFLAPAEKNTGAAIVICPGGGYGGLAGHEGKGYAENLMKSMFS